MTLIISAMGSSSKLALSLLMLTTVCEGLSLRPKVHQPRRVPCVTMLAESVDGTLLQQIPTLLAEDVFGEVFLAGMSIALAGVGTTVLAAFIVNGRYDEIEASIFEAQDRDVQSAQPDAVEDDVKAFFGDVAPQQSAKSADNTVEPDASETVAR